MMSGEMLGESNPPAQQSDTSPVPENSGNAIDMAPEVLAAQAAFLEIKAVLTDRQAQPDPLPGWILPRVDDKAAVSRPRVEDLSQNQ